MKRFTRLLTALLSASLATSCASTGEVPSLDDTTTSETSASEAVNTPKSSVPDGVTFDGEVINIWTTTNPSNELINLEGEHDGDIVNDGIYQVNLAVADRLNIDIKWHDSGIYANDIGTEISKLILADDTTYDVMNIVQYGAGYLCAEGLYCNMMGAPYIDLTNPWWDYEYMKEMTVGDDKLFLLVGDFSIDRTRTLNCIFYNKRIYSDFYREEDGLYQEVIDGKWTVDRMMEICRMTYNDLNQNDTVDPADMLGCAGNTDNSLDNIFYGMGAEVTSRDEKGIPSFTVMTEHIADVCTKLYEFFCETEGVHRFSDRNQVLPTFTEGRSTFMIGFFYDTDTELMRSMNDNYGILPSPKYDESQKEYVTGRHNVMRDMVLPINCQKVDAVCAMLEEMGYQSYINLLPKYYEQALKQKYARDELSGQMIDIIRNNCSTDFAYIYGDYCNTIGILHRTMINKGLSSVSSLFAERESVAKEKMQTLIDRFMK